MNDEYKLLLICFARKSFSENNSIEDKPEMWDAMKGQFYDMMPH